MRNYFKVFTVGEFSIVTHISDEYEEGYRASGDAVPAQVGDRWEGGQVLVGDGAYDFTPFMDDIKAGFKALAQTGLDEAFGFVFGVNQRQENIYRDKFEDAKDFLFHANVAYKESLKSVIKSCASTAEWDALEADTNIPDPYTAFAQIIYGKGLAFRATQNTIDNIRRQADDLIASQNDFMSLVMVFKAFESQTRAYFAQSQLAG